MRINKYLPAASWALSVRASIAFCSPLATRCRNAAEAQQFCPEKMLSCALDTLRAFVPKRTVLQMPSAHHNNGA